MGEFHRSRESAIRNESGDRVRLMVPNLKGWIRQPKGETAAAHPRSKLRGMQGAAT
jgi:hypothetical protein